MFQKNRSIEITNEDLCRVVQLITRAWYIMQDISEDFFLRFNPKKPEEAQCILLNFDRHAAKAGILDDLISESHTLLDSLTYQPEEELKAKGSAA